MNYKENRIIHILKYYNGSIPNDGEHSWVFNKDNVNENICSDLSKYGYKVKINSNKTIINLYNDNHKFKLDYRANNITSSSMLSACYFAYLSENIEEFERFIKKLFIENFNKVIIPKDINVELECVDEFGDKSHFDVRITFFDKVEYTIFIEVKYCEEAYGKKQRFDSAKNPVEEKQNEYIKHTIEAFNRHSALLNIDNYLNVNNIDFGKCYDSDYVKRYQIIRNISHADINDNRYVVFLLAKGNNKADEDIKSGCRELEEYNKEIIKSNVTIIYFEDYVNKNSELFKKYFEE